jgi:single-strand DNA-binding protein
MPSSNATSTSSRSSDVPVEAPACSNLVILRGVVSADLTDRALPSGSVVVQFDVRTAASSVNVSWADPPTDARAAILLGAEVVVIGTVQRRFFRVGGATQSRTEVVADQVIPARRTRSVRSAIAAAALSLGD